MPDESTATALPLVEARLSPPNLLAHTRSPDESNFDTNASGWPVTAAVNSVVPAPGLKSTVSRNCPVVYTLPDESTDTDLPVSLLPPPQLLAHR